MRIRRRLSRRRLSSRFAGRLQGRDEAGVTLVELAIVMITLLILFAMTVPIIDTLFSTIARVNNTYINVNQLLPVSTNLQRFVRSAVEPGPTTSGVPVPAFVTGALTPTSMTFYTNVGDANGPSKIVASCTASTPSSGLCDSGATFTVTQAKANSGTCPPTGSACTWGAAKTLISVTGVDNANDSAPLFVYTLLLSSSTSSGTTETTSVVGGSPTCPGTYSTLAACYYATDISTFATCTSTGSTTGNVLANCPSAEVYALTVDLQVNSVTSGKSAAGQAEDNTTVYLLSPVSDDYQASVG